MVPSSCLHRNVHHGGAEISPIAGARLFWQLVLLFSAPPLCWGSGGTTSAAWTGDLLPPVERAAGHTGCAGELLVGPAFCLHAVRCEEGHVEYWCPHALFV